MKGDGTDNNHRRNRILSLESNYLRGWHYGHYRHHRQQDENGDEPEYHASIQHLTCFSPPKRSAKKLNEL